MIPLSKDVGSLIGEWAEDVDNRALLHGKFALPKVWDQSGAKIDQASRWSILRIVSRGAELLKADARKLRTDANGANTTAEVSERKNRDAAIAERMSSTAPPDLELVANANANARAFQNELLKSYSGQIITFEAALASRMMVNLAGGVIENAGLALDRCFGLPFIPGSAVKGVARTKALTEVRNAEGAQKIELLRLAMLLFGYGERDLTADFAWAGGSGCALTLAQEIGGPEIKGCACFLPAYPTNESVIIVDMLNPHYPQYYAGKEAFAADIDSPVPNYFPAVEVGSSFGFAVVLSRLPNAASIAASNLLTQARHWVESAVTERGIGAKTAAGYGSFRLRDDGPQMHLQSDLFPPSEGTAEAVLARKLSISATLPAIGQPVYVKWCDKTINGIVMPALTRDLDALPVDVASLVLEELLPEAARTNRTRKQEFWMEFVNPVKNPKGSNLLEKLNIVLSRA